MEKIDGNHWTHYAITHDDRPKAALCYVHYLPRPRELHRSSRPTVAYLFTSEKHRGKGMNTAIRSLTLKGHNVLTSDTSLTLDSQRQRERFARKSGVRAKMGLIGDEDQHVIALKGKRPKKPH